MNETKELTYGEKAVGLNFNLSADDAVTVTKRFYAQIIDLLDMYRKERTDPEEKRLFSVAITEAQSSQMWAVKGITWK